MTPKGIETATFKLEAHCLNQLHYRVSSISQFLIKVSTLRSLGMTDLN
jgi:hypothetical protein